jgi:hypothetical protein
MLERGHPESSGHASLPENAQAADVHRPEPGPAVELPILTLNTVVELALQAFG